MFAIIIPVPIPHLKGFIFGRDRVGLLKNAAGHVSRITGLSWQYINYNTHHGVGDEVSFDLSFTLVGRPKGLRSAQSLILDQKGRFLSPVPAVDLKIAQGSAIAPGDSPHFVTDPWRNWSVRFNIADLDRPGIVAEVVDQVPVTGSSVGHLLGEVKKDSRNREEFFLSCSAWCPTYEAARELERAIGMLPFKHKSVTKVPPFIEPRQVG